MSYNNLMSRFLTKISAGLLLFFLVFFWGTPTARAALNSSVKVGTHLYNFDPNAQIKTIQRLKEKGLPAPYPITLMISAKHPGDFAGVLSEASQSPFAPIVRIIEIGKDTPSSAMTDVANVLNGSSLPAGTAVELGNELYRAGGGDKGPEWDGTTIDTFDIYAALYNQLDSSLDQKFLLGMAAMNPIPDGGGLFSSESIMDRILPQITRVQATFANIYKEADCATNTASCLSQKSQWSLNYINKSKGTSLDTKSLYVTEFGNLTCSLDDYDCLQQFYEDFSSLPAKAITGFAATPGLPANASYTTYKYTVPMICQYWDLTSYEVFTPKKCGGGAQPLYIFPGIDDQSNYLEKLKLAATYKMTCANPYTFKGVVINENYSAPNFVRTLTCPGNTDCIIPDVIGTAKIDNGKTTIPLFRMQGADVPNPAASGRRLDDLEGFYGSKYVATDPTGNSTAEAGRASLLGSGTTNKLTTPQAQCIQTVNFLHAIDEACKQPQPPSSSLVNNASPQPTPTSSPGSVSKCALDLKVSGTQETYLSILNRIGSYSCGPSQKLSADNEKLFSSVELSLPKAFKPAYIVRYVNSPQIDADPTTLSTLMTWMSPGKKDSSASAKLKSRLQITKVFVPAGVASTPNDTSTRSTSNYIKYTAPLMQALQVVTPLQRQQKIQEHKEKQINEIFALSQASSMQNPDVAKLGGLFNTKGHVNCPECSDSDLETIFARRINAEIDRVRDQGDTNNDCSLSDLAGETAQKSHIINPEGTLDPVQKTEEAIRASLYSGLSDDGGRVTLRTFFFVPEEYRNLSDYENVVANSLLEEKTGAKIIFSDTKIKDGDKNYKYLQLSNTAFNVDSPQIQGSIIGYTESIAPADPTAGNTSTTNKTYINLFGQVVGDSMPTDYNPNPQVPGGKLARGIWDVVCHLAQPFQPGKKSATYMGLEKILESGTGACFEDESQKTPPDLLCEAPKENMVCKNWRSGQGGDSVYSQWLTTWTDSSSEDVTSCTPSGSSGGSGQSANITAGAVALALKVSKITCVPAEVLIGVMAKESGGYKDNDSVPFDGVATEMYMRNGCDSLDLSNTSAGSGYYLQACGPFQYTQSNITGDPIAKTSGQIGKYGADIKPCLQALEIDIADNALDTRMLGVSLCTAAANMSRGSTCSAVNATCSTAPKLTDWSTDQINNAVMTFHANACGVNATTSPYSNALPNYRGFIDQYKWFVDKVRQQTLSCIGNSTSSITPSTQKVPTQN